MSNWIKVKDRLPETRQEILFFVSVSYAGIHAQQGIFVENYENEHGNHGSIFIKSDGSRWKLDYVSHWMPLPEPPKRELI